MAFRELLLIAAASFVACGAPTSEFDLDVPVHVGIVAIDEHGLPVVILEEDHGSRRLPIWIGTAEARSIALAMERQRAKRPDTHDLAGQLILGLAAELDRVVVTELKDGTYFATIVLASDDGTVDVDARPSDAIAIALRAAAPIFVRASLLDEPRAQPTASRPERHI